MKISFSNQDFSGISFADAFQAARQELGNHGVFIYEGRPYNTLELSEQNAMLPDEWEDFSTSVQSALGGFEPSDPFNLTNLADGHAAEISVPDNLISGLQPDAPQGLLGGLFPETPEIDFPDVVSSHPTLFLAASTAPESNFLDAVGDLLKGVGDLIGGIFGDD